MLNNLFEIFFQCPGQFVDLLAQLVAERGGFEQVVQFTGQFGRDCREIIDKIEGILDLVRDPGRKLAERSQLLSLNEAILRGP